MTLTTTGLCIFAATMFFVLGIRKGLDRHRRRMAKLRIQSLVGAEGKRDKDHETRR